MIELNNLKSVLDFNRSQKTIEEEELEKGFCPDCDCRLKIREDVTKSCPCCGKIYD